MLSNISDALAFASLMIEEKEKATAGRVPEMELSALENQNRHDTVSNHLQQSGIIIQRSR